VDEVHGNWGKAESIPGLAQSNVGNGHAISCWAPGSCDAVGSISVAATGSPAAYYVEERGGTWRDGHEVPGLGVVAGSSYTIATTVSCDSKGDCAAGGLYGGGNFVVDKVDGTWHDAASVPDGGSQSTEISCLADDHCVMATDVYKPVETGQLAAGPQ
jgi:hypothetical protein